MTMQRLLDRYKRESILSTPKEELIPLLYQRAVDHLRIALERHAGEDLAGFGIHLRKAQAIVTELRAGLDREAGAEIVRDLERLYDFMIHRLVEADLRKEPTGVREVMDLLDKLEEGWRHAVARFKQC